MIDRKIPAFQRNTLPVVVTGGRIAAVFGLGMDPAFRPAPGEEALVLRWESQYREEEVNE